MSEKPSYLGLLNAVAVGELGGEALFDAWAETTTSDDVRCVLRTVARREGEHARSFAKRIDELGYEVIPKDDPGLADRIATVRSTELCDREKFEKLGFARGPRDGKDIFGRFLEDVTIDIQTGELIGRYISEERDTGRRLLACYGQLQEAERAAAASGSAGSMSAGLPAEVSERLCRIEAALETLALAAATAASASGASATAAMNGSGKKSGKQHAKH